MTISYDRIKAVAYAREWAFGRNPAYYNFDHVGGDCTNFVSQCIFAGAGVMNFTPVTGWFYLSVNDRTASWTGVEYLYRFLTQNEGAGPFGSDADLSLAETGDVIQLGRETGDFYHTAIITGFAGGTPLVAAQTFNAYDKPLRDYAFERARLVHIEGVRK